MSIRVTGSPWRTGEFIYPDDDTDCRLLGEHVDHLHLTLRWSCKLASPPAMTPGHCQHRSVSPITLTTRGGANTPLEAAVGTTGATSAEANLWLQLLHRACFLWHKVSKRVAHKRHTVCSSLNWTQTGMICSEMNHAVLPYSVHDSDFTSAPIGENCFGSKRADTPAFLKETWHPKQPSDLSLGSKALHLQDWNF